MQTIRTAILAAMFTSVLAAAANAGSEAASEAMKDAKKTAFRLVDKETVAVIFTKGQSAVSESDKADLKALYDAAKADAKIDQVIVAAWSDHEYPANKDQHLDKTDRKLADDRAYHVKQALEAIGAKNVETFSMAEHPSWISKKFRTENAKLKGAVAPKDLDDAAVEEIGKELRRAGGPGKAVVFVRRENMGLSH